jgi:hypothetical protein
MATEDQTQLDDAPPTEQSRQRAKSRRWDSPFLRSRAKRKPFLCPECGEAVETD